MAQGTVPVNAEAGEVALEVKAPNGDVLETYVLRFKTNACCRLESLLGKRERDGTVTPVPIEKLMPRLMMPSVNDARAMICAGLGDRHPDVTLEEAGNIADRVGLKNTITLLGEAMRRGFPDMFGDPDNPEPTVKEGKAPAVPGTGNGSSRTRRRPVSAP